MNRTMIERYEQAQTVMQSGYTNKLVRNDTVFPHWINYGDQSDSNCFWYQRQTVEGKEYRFVNVEAASNTLAFDHHSLAELLSNAQVSNKNKTAPQKAINPLNLPLRSVSMTLEKKGAPLCISFQALNKYWDFNPDSLELKEAAAPQGGDGLLSPDGGKIAFIRDDNLWVRDQITQEEQQLTEDGEEDYHYGMDQRVHQTVLWSPDSQSVLCTQLDTRKVRRIPHVNYGPIDTTVYTYLNLDLPESSLYPEVIEKKQAYPGDEYIPTQQFSVVRIATGQVQKLDYPPIREINFIVSPGLFDTRLSWWSTDNRRAFFLDSPRDSRVLRVVEWDTQTGATRVVFEETDKTRVRFRYDFISQALIVPLPATDELIWFSERCGWGHLYLYDLTSGELKHQITNGDWLVRDILHLDADKRELLLQTAGRHSDRNPYYRDICKVNIDSGVLIPLVDGDFEYVVHQPLVNNSNSYIAFTGNDRPNGVSPSGDYLVTTFSRVDTVPVSVLITRDGKELLTLETMDTSGLPDDWQWPEPVTLKASDNTTDICAVVYRPPGFSPDQSYPVVDFMSSTRGVSEFSVGSFSNNPFCGANYIGAAALAALGFIVVAIDGRGTAHRNKAFALHHHGDQAYSSDFTDRIAGLRQLAERYPSMDLEHVGISANEDVCNNAIYASLLYSDFYKVSVIHCMPDLRFWVASACEEVEISRSSTAETKTPYPEDCVDTFKGKLLLVQPMGLYSEIQPAFLLVDALIKANKDFDMVCIPNLHSQVCAYDRRREWDYLVTHLQGGEPPEQFQLTTGKDLATAALRAAD